jgi:hypothetical protein
MSVDGRLVWSAQFDTVDRVTQLNLGDSGTYQFTYSALRNGAATQVDIKDPEQKVLRITYDDSGSSRLQHLASASPTSAPR